MSKKDKPLLSESVTRRFMKLANVSNSLSENFVSDRYLSEEEEEMDMGMDAPMPPEDEDADPVGDDAGMMDDAPDDMGGDMGEPEVEKLVSAIADAIQNVTGVAVDVEGGEGGEEMPAGDDMDMEMDMGEPDMGGDEPEMDMGDDDAANRGMYEGQGHMAPGGTDLSTQGGNKHKEKESSYPHKNKKVSGADLASQGQGLVKEEEDQDEDDKEDVKSEGMYNRDEDKDEDKDDELSEAVIEEVTRRVAERLMKRIKK